MVAALFCRRDSIYKSLPGVDVYDAERDALTFRGDDPVVAHPPCREWSRLRHFAKPIDGERELAFNAVSVVRKNGGVLEHPAGSALWKEAGLPDPGCTDEFGGWTLPIDQFWFGHRARKRTLLYIVGVRPGKLPPMPIVLGEAPKVCGLWSGRDRARCRGEIGKKEREATPVALAYWLVAVAKLARVQHG